MLAEELVENKKEDSLKDPTITKETEKLNKEFHKQDLVTTSIKLKDK